MGTRDKFLGIGGLLVLGTIVAGAAFGQVKPPVTVRVGHVGLEADAHFYIALEKGYFRDAAIDVKLEWFASGAAAIAPLSAGQLDVAGGVVGAGLFNAFARGLPIRAVATRIRNFPGHSSAAFLVQTDMKGQIKSVADLKGKKVAHPFPGAPTLFMLGRALEKEGLTIKDVENIYMPFPDMGVALRNKAIDAAVIPEPFATVFPEKGLAAMWKRVSDLVEPMEVSVLFYNQDWAEKNPQLAREFMVAYIRGARDYYEASIGGKTRPDVVSALVKYTPVKDRAIYEKIEWYFPDPNGTILKESLKEQQEWFHKNGMVPTKVDVDALVDETFTRYAVQKLGTYTVKERAK